jgi:hypothetical protein
LLSGSGPHADASHILIVADLPYFADHAPGAVVTSVLRDAGREGAVVRLESAALA